MHIYFMKEPEIKNFLKSDELKIMRRRNKEEWQSTIRYIEFLQINIESRNRR